MKIDATHTIWPWIAEHAGFLLTRFEVGRDGKTAYERLKGKSAKVQGMSFAGRIWWKRKRAGGPLGKLTCMWEDGVYLNVKATTAEVIVGNRNGVWLTRTVRRTPAEERWDRSNLEMVVAVPLRKNEDDPMMDGERLKSEVKVMVKKYKERWEAEKHVPIPKRVYISRANLEEFGVHSEMSGMHVIAPRDCETSAYGQWSKANRGGAEGLSEGARGDETHERVPRQSGLEGNKTDESRPGRRTATT